MSINNTSERRAGPYDTDGVDTDFTFEFKVFEEVDLVVTSSEDGTDTELVYETDYTVALNADQEDDPGGTVTLLTAPDGPTITITSDMDYTQPTVFTNSGGFYPRVLNNSLDRATILIQQLKELVSRALVAPFGAEAVAGQYPVVLPDGTYGYSSGTGADAGLREDLSAPDGLGIVGFQQAGTGSALRTAEEKARERMSLADKGAAGDDTVQTDAFDDARDSLTAGGTIDVGIGQFRVAGALPSREVHLAGEGMLASIVRPATATGVAMRGKFGDGAWEPMVFSDLSLVGIGTLQGTGYRAGSDAFAANDHFIISQVFDRVGFLNLDKGAEFAFGNIGKWFNDCTGNACNYHLWMKSYAPETMHAGCIVANRGHWWGAEKASVYVDGDDVIGAGQFTFQDGIRESNPGWVYYFTGLSGMTAATPGVSILREWNENNHTAVSVDVEGDVGAPGWGYFSDVPSVIIEDTPLGPVDLAETHITTRNCDLSHYEATSTDAFSSVIHEQARRLIGPAQGLVWSLGSILNPGGLNAPSFYMPRPVGVWPYTTDTLFANHAQAVISFTGSAARDTVPVTGDPGLPWLLYSQDFTINAAENEFPIPVDFTVPEDKHVVLLYVVKLISGPSVTAQITGTTGFGPALTIDNEEWRTLTGVLYNAGAPVAGESLWHSSSGTSVIRIGGFAAVQFDTAQEARAFINRGLFPAAVRPAYTVTNTTASRTLNADTAAGTASVGYVQAELQAAMDRLNALEKVVATNITDQRSGNGVG